MAQRTQDLLDEKPCSTEPHHFYLVSWQAGSICCAKMKSASCVPIISPILLITLNCLCYFLVQGLSPSWKSQTHICFGKTSQCVHKQCSELALTWRSKVHTVFPQLSRVCPTPSDPMDCSLPGSSVRGIFQARVLEWDAIALPGV